jgi:hypothetical protein
MRIRASAGSARAVAPALGDQREAHLRERFQLAHHSVAATVASLAPRAAPQRVFNDSQRKFALEGLDRGVERVAHRHVHRAGAVGVGAGALATPERLVVGERRAPERQVVHRALALGVPEGAEDEIGHTR